MHCSIFSVNLSVKYELKFVKYNEGVIPGKLVLKMSY